MTPDPRDAIANEDSAVGPIADRREPSVIRLGRPLLAKGLRGFFACLGGLRVEGVENIPPAGPLLIAANHASNLDPLAGWAAVYPARRMWAIAKSELWHGPLMRAVMEMMRGIPVRRGGADRATIRRALDMLRAGEAVGIFPEGTRSRDGRLQPAQPGLALLVQRSGAPVLPVAIVGTHAMLPPGRSVPRRGQVIVAFGKPLRFDPGAPREVVLESVMAAIAEVMSAAGGTPGLPGPGPHNPDAWSRHGADGA